MSATVRVVCPRCNGTAVDPYMRDANHFAIADDPKCACLAGVGGCAGLGYVTRELHPSDPLAAPLAVDGTNPLSMSAKRWADICTPLKRGNSQRDEIAMLKGRLSDAIAEVHAAWLALSAAPTERKPSDG